MLVHVHLYSDLLNIWCSSAPRPLEGAVSAVFMMQTLNPRTPHAAALTASVSEPLVVSRYTRFVKSTDPN